MNAQEYIAKHFGTVDGWLWEQAVYVAELLITAQRDMAVDGATMEIGVWKGKYFGSIVALAPEREAYGIDIWLHNQAGEVEAFLKKVSPGTEVTLCRANTFDCDIDVMRRLVRDRKIAFASVDGSHEALPIEHDLLNTLQLLCPGGIIAIDDFLNPLTLGVTEGVVSFLKACPTVEAICWSANKLYVTTAGWSELYQIRLRMWLDGGAATVLLKKDRLDWAHHTTRFLGRPVIVF